MGILGGGNRVILVVFSIADHDYGLVALFLHSFHGEALRASHNGVADSGSLNRNGVGVDSGKEHLGGNIVCGYWNLDKTLPGKNYQAYTVAVKLVHKAGQVHLGPFQTVRRIILGLHRVGNVQSHHNLASCIAALAELCPYLRTGKAEHQKQPGKAEAGKAEPALGAGTLGHKGRYHFRIPETPQPAVSSPAVQSVEHIEKRYREYEKKKYRSSKL